MNEMKFSVSMCVYGGDNPEWFKTSVDSILSQTVVPDEIVLVVDGPVPDKLDEVIKEYENTELFNVIRLSENQGHGNARRIGLEKCRNELVALMDADDISAPTRFEKQLAVLSEQKDIAVVGGNISEFVDDPDNIVGVRKVPQADEEIKAYLKKRCPFNQVTVMFKKTEVEAAGGYIDWYCEEDYYLWIRLFLSGAKFANIDENIVNVRVGNDMYKRRGGIKYYKSEAKLQKYMLEHKVIDYKTYVCNCAKRLIVQVLLPNRLRGWIFKKFAREKA